MSDLKYIDRDCWWLEDRTYCYCARAGCSVEHGPCPGYKPPVMLSDGRVVGGYDKKARIQHKPERLT